MKARQFIEGSTYGPATLKVICRAFDDAWLEVTPSVDDSPLVREAARLGLASIMLSIAREDSRDADHLKSETLQIFRSKRDHRNDALLTHVGDGIQLQA